MNTIYISSTELKKRISEVINRVYFEKRETIVERHGRPMVKISPIIEEKKSRKPTKSLNDFFGVLPDFPDVTKDRRSGRRKVEL